MPQIPGYAVFVFPLALIVFLAWWFFQCARAPRIDDDKYAWVREGPKRLLDIGNRGRMAKKDFLPLFSVTLAYAIAAFTYLGTTSAPQSFWKAEADEQTVTIDLGEAVVIDIVFYYTGSFHGSDGKSYYKLEFSEDGVNYRLQPEMFQKHSQTFQWVRSTLNEPLAPTRYVRITAQCTPLELGELCLIAGTDGERYNVTDKMNISVSPENGNALFDEQSLIPQSRMSINGTYFDEIYHARAAYENINGIFNYEITHPPLGKQIMTLGVKIFGMTPFGWRFMGTLFGVLMLPLFYLLIKQLFNSTLISFCGTVVWAADFMHFSQTRIATIDTYNVFFVLLMFIFMHRWLTMPNGAPFLKTLVPLSLCGLSFGLGAASKWSSIYAGIGLLVLYVIKLATCKRGIGFIIGTLLASAAFFLVIPAGIYFVSYIPYVTSKGLNLNIANLWDELWRNQTYMYNYHSRLVDTHPYSSRWYDWLIDGKSICYFYQRLGDGKFVSTIMTFNSPVLAWGGLAAMVFCVVDIFRSKCFKALFILCGYLSVFMPWVLVSRLTFPYHYFPASMFLAMAICYVFRHVADSGDAKRARTLIVSFSAVATALFLMFYPVISGIPVLYTYYKYVLQWLPRWLV